MANINAKDRWDWTPLWWAARNGHEAIVKLLLETGQADVDISGWNGQTPLSIATKYEYEAIIKLLPEYKQGRR